jgi:lysophospholipid acyltransferase (LPLAT)-like uncharacterized protein
MRDFAAQILTRLVARALRLLGATWRVEMRGANPLESERTSGLLTAVWHRNLLIGSYVFRDADVHVPISLSRDGSRIAAIARRMGFADPPRGSSSRAQFSLLKDLVRRARAGAVITVLTDGPRGPARQSKSGIAHAARMTGVPLLPVAFSARPCIQFGSWDGTLLPLPFARVVCAFGQPVDLSGVPDDDFDEEAPRVLDAALDRLTDEIDREVGLVPRATRRR